MDKRTVLIAGSWIGIMTILVSVCVIAGIIGYRLYVGAEKSSLVTAGDQEPSPYLEETPIAAVEGDGETPVAVETPTAVETPVAVVGSDPIYAAEYRFHVTYWNISYIQNYRQLVQYFGDDPSFRQQYQSAMDNLGPTVQTALVEDRLIRQEAARRGIVVTKREIDQAMQAGLGYYPDGTPTPEPTSTTTGITSEESSATPAPAPTLGPTSTPFTYFAYQEVYQNYLIFYANYQITERDLRHLIESQLYREKVQSALLGDSQSIPDGQEHLWARHILVDSGDIAKEIISKLNQGDDFAALATQYSIDTGSGALGGDLGWFPRGQMVIEFEQAAFALENIGDFTQEPVKTTFGFHIIQLLGWENRPFTSDAEKFSYWLNLQKQSVNISTSTDLELSKWMPPLYPLPTAQVKITEETP